MTLGRLSGSADGVFKFAAEQELIKSQEKNVGLAEEALRLAKARLDAGAGVQLDVLDAQVQLLTAQSTQLQAFFGYNSSLAEFDRATGAQYLYRVVRQSGATCDAIEDL